MTNACQPIGGTDAQKSWDDVGALRDPFGFTLHTAVCSGDVEWVKRSLRRGNANATDKLGRTPLHLAAEGGHKAIIELLLQAGAKNCL